MKTVHVVLGCSDEGCENAITLTEDVLPAGWWTDGEGREFCPRHVPLVQPRDVEPEEVWDEALALNARTETREEIIAEAEAMVADVQKEALAMDARRAQEDESE